MSYRNNDVFNVLTTSGNTALLTAGGTEADLVPGQLGLFDATTGLSVTAAAPASYYFALAIGDGEGNLAANVVDIRRSAGQYIQRAGIVSNSFKAHGAGRPMIVEISNFSGLCAKEYGIRVEQRNSRIARLTGTIPFTNYYSVKAKCCDPCVDDCESADPNDIAVKLVENINLNSNGTLIATLNASQGNITVTTEPTANGNLTVTLGSEAAFTVAILDADTGAGVATKLAAGINAVVGTAYNAIADGTSVLLSGPNGAVTVGVAATGTVVTTEATSNQEVTDSAAFLADNPDATFTVQLQSVPVPVTNSSSFNLHFYKTHQTLLVVSLVEGFDCSGTITTIQELAEAEGLGSHIRQLEMKATAWYSVNASPYIASEVTNSLAEGDYTALTNGVYDQFIHEYNCTSESGWLEYQNAMSTIFAVPGADTVTRNSLATVLDVLGASAGLEALADDAAAANVDPDVMEIVIVDPLKDGLA